MQNEDYKCKQSSAFFVILFYWYCDIGWYYIYFLPPGINYLPEKDHNFYIIIKSRSQANLAISDYKIHNVNTVNIVDDLINGNHVEWTTFMLPHLEVNSDDSTR